MLGGPDPTEAEKRLLDEEWAEFEKDGDLGKPWQEVVQAIRNKGSGPGPTDVEKQLLVQAWDDFEKSGEVPVPWREFMQSLKNSEFR
jgi:hypothetical protein